MCTVGINIRACCMHICPILFQKRMDYRWLQTETCIRSCSRNHSESSSTKSYPNGSNLRRHLMEVGIPGMSVKVHSENAGVSADFDTFWCSSIIIKWAPECSVEDLPSTSIRTSCATFKYRWKSEGHLVLMVLVCEANLNLFARSLQLLNEAAWEPLGVTFVFLLHRSFEELQFCLKMTLCWQTQGSEPCQSTRLFLRMADGRIIHCSVSSGSV